MTLGNNSTLPLRPHEYKPDGAGEEADAFGTEQLAAALSWKSFAASPAPFGLVDVKGGNLN